MALSSNTITRSISGAVFLMIMIGGILAGEYTYAALMMFVMCAMVYEFCHISMGNKYTGGKILTVLTGASFFILVYHHAAYGMPIKYMALAVIPLFILMIHSLYVKDKTDYGKFSNMFTSLLYIAIPMSLSNLIVFTGGHYNGLLMLSFFVIIWAGDVGGYIFGCTLGKNGKKLFPSISPKKSWAGFWGGLGMAIAVSVIMSFTTMLRYPIMESGTTYGIPTNTVPWYVAVGLAIVMNIFGVYGDLFESQWKRYYDIKDSGNMIPGHGGMLDRFDSSLMAIPAGAIFLTVCNML